MKIGFTGTRRGMTLEQQETIRAALNLNKRDLEIHHGDCEGADEQFHDLAGRVNAIRIVHPPVDNSHRANDGHGVMFFNERRGPKTHFARNRDIVNETDRLIATPCQTSRPPLKTGGGTWYTIRYAEKQGKPVFIVWPNGTVGEAPAPLAEGGTQ